MPRAVVQNGKARSRTSTHSYRLGLGTSLLPKKHLVNRRSTECPHAPLQRHEVVMTRVGEPPCGAEAFHHFPHEPLLFRERTLWGWRLPPPHNQNLEGWVPDPYPPLWHQVQFPNYPPRITL